MLFPPYERDFRQGRHRGHNGEQEILSDPKKGEAFIKELKKAVA